ncbi:MAG: phenylalanine--tRNA ligase subunit alpha [Acidobacteriota bacterium]
MDDTGDMDSAAQSEQLANIQALLDSFEEAAGAVRTLAELDELRARYLGRRRGHLTAIFDGLRALPPTLRRQVGKEANLARQRFERRLRELANELDKGGAASPADDIDVSLPGRSASLGNLHPISLTLQEIESVFTRMGYRIVEGPEVENDWYNFEALNMPADHPARDAFDTLYLEQGQLLRTHTSPVQIRTMEEEEPPLAIIVPGRVYRRDTADATHLPSFVQCEGLVVDKGITMADLKGTLDHFAKALFGHQTRTRFRPGYFPFTEPSGELDATCPSCAGKGCQVCKSSGWIEMLGCGMVHPLVFRSVGYDPETVSGFAFGMGIDRIAAVRYGIDDIRLLYENDIRFLQQFAG